MSAIFGFSFRSADQQKMEDTLGGLEYWNRIYGSEAYEAVRIGTSGLACRIEHFSDKFPYGGPLLKCMGMDAVVDVLLFNRDELLPLLELSIDSRISDEELLLQLIEKKGFPILKTVNGDFAGAIYDRESRTWILFRDHMGVRPLYYYMDRDTFVFSTDLRGIVAVPGVDSHFHEMQLFLDVIRGNTLSLTDTNFQYIKCALPGCVSRFTMTDTDVTMTQSIYWKPREKKIRLSSDEEYRSEMRRLVTDAVHRRCDAFPGVIGGELSGGLDSCVIDILINRYGRKGVYYSWSLPPEVSPLRDGEDERKVILDVCEQENITCRFMHMEDQFDFLYMLDQQMPPYINAPHLAFGSRWMKKQGAKAIFSGYGGDEGVSHRCRPYELLWNGEILSYFKIYYQYLKGKPFRLLRTIRSGIIDAWDRYRKFHPRILASDLSAPVLTKAFNERMAKQFRYVPLTFSYAPHLYVRQGGTRSRLDNAAFMGAYCGVRYLFPYVDYRVMDFALSIPRRLHINHATSRLIFRETFDDLMPQSLRNVIYKDMASTRSANITNYANKSFHHNINWLLEHLDREIWGDVIDFHGLEELHRSDIIEKKDIGIYTLLMHKLNKCLSIQNIQKNAKRWREFDAENKLL